MAPEAYTLKDVVAGWMQQESKDQIRMRAAAAYAQYQKCIDGAAMRLFSSKLVRCILPPGSVLFEIPLRNESRRQRELTQSRRTPYNF